MEKDRILKRLDELIEMAKSLTDYLEVDKWRFSCKNLIKLVYPDFDFEQRDNHLLFITYSDSRYRQLLGLLYATRDDLEKGFLENREQQVKKVEINSLLDYAYELFNEKDDVLDRCACILGRIVLEKTLQLLCIKNDIEFTKTKASILNQNLRDNEVYNVTQWEQINYLYRVGSAASHSSEDWNEIGPEQRRKAVRDIEDIMRRML